MEKQKTPAGGLSLFRCLVPRRWRRGTDLDAFLDVFPRSAFGCHTFFGCVWGVMFYERYRRFFTFVCQICVKNDSQRAKTNCARKRLFGRFEAFKKKSALRGWREAPPACGRRRASSFFFPKYSAPKKSYLFYLKIHQRPPFCPLYRINFREPRVNGGI